MIDNIILQNKANGGLKEKLRKTLTLYCMYVNGTEEIIYQILYKYLNGGPRYYAISCMPIEYMETAIFLNFLSFVTSQTNSVSIDHCR